MRTGRPSLTARWVAAQRLRLDPIRASTPVGDLRGERALYRGVRGRVSALAPTLDRPAGFARRTAFVDREVADALGRGVEQVGLVGAGYDGRALRFAGSTRWFEVDRPTTQDDKRRRLAARGPAPAPTPPVTYAGLDLTVDDVGAALEAAGHRADAPTLFVCDGVFPHLTLAAVASLCEALRARAPEGSVLASTFLVAPAAGAGIGAAAALAGRKAADGLLALGGQPRRSEFLVGDPEKLMVVTGWRVGRSQRTGPARLHPGANLLALSARPAP
jgi:methyltransferase (TIGR00027 family)